MCRTLKPVPTYFFIILLQLILFSISLSNGQRNNSHLCLTRFWYLFFSVVRRSANTTDKGPLVLEWINYCFTKNGQKHRSDMYYCMNEKHPTLVVRRGLPICFYLKFDREFDITTDNVSFMFKLAGNYHFIYTLHICVTI